MIRYRVMAGILSVFGLFAWATGVQAEEPKPAKSTGVRVGEMLVLFGCESSAASSLVKAAGIEGHQWQPGPYIGTWGHSVKHGDKGLEKLESLERGDFDTLLLATPHYHPHEETWAGHMGLDSLPAGLCAIGVKNNPKFRLVWQSFYWPRPLDRENKVLDWKPRTAPPDGLRALEKLTDQINDKHGRKVMVISPVEEATCKLIEMVAAGKFPGVTDPATLWFEVNMWIPGSHMRTLFAYTNVATIYGVSPVGLNPDFSDCKWGGGKSAPTEPKTFADLAPITEEQRTILQQIAWETVSNYPYSGVQKP